MAKFQCSAEVHSSPKRSGRRCGVKSGLRMRQTDKRWFCASHWSSMYTSAASLSNSELEDLAHANAILSGFEPGCVVKLLPGPADDGVPLFCAEDTRTGMTTTYSRAPGEAAMLLTLALLRRVKEQAQAAEKAEKDKADELTRAKEHAAKFTAEERTLIDQWVVALWIHMTGPMRGQVLREPWIQRLEVWPLKPQAKDASNAYEHAEALVIERRKRYGVTATPLR